MKEKEGRKETICDSKLSESRTSYSPKDQKILEKINYYMEGSLEFQSSEDISYKWIKEDENIKLINRPIVSSLEDLKNQINSRDLICELKVGNN